ncbi:hypothetical protein ACJZ2D_014360 [Fusarium nematophilum]
MLRKILRLLLKRQDDLPDSKPSPTAKQPPLGAQPTNCPPPPPYPGSEQTSNTFPEPGVPSLAHSQCGGCVQRSDIYVQQRSGLAFDKIDSQGLVENDEGLAGVLCSLGYLYKVSLPKNDLLSLINEADERPAPVLCQHLCSQILAERGHPPSFRSSNVEDLRKYTWWILDTIPTKPCPAEVPLQWPPFSGKATDILQFLYDTGTWLEWLNWHRVTRIQFALIIGFCLGESNQLAQPDISMAGIIESARRLCFERGIRARLISAE